MAATPDGGRIYVTGEGWNDVSVVGLTTGKTSTIAVGSAPPQIVVVPGASAAKPSSRTRISIANLSFAPSEITVAPGTTVTCTNENGPPHRLASSDGSNGIDLLLPGARVRGSMRGA
jgi:YVTN family beta-propeller protein